MDDVPCLSADKLYPIQSAVTGRRLQILLRTALRRAGKNFVVEVFSCEATEDREAGCRGLWFCNVAEWLRYGFCYG